MLRLCLALVLTGAVLASPIGAQVLDRPTPRPTRTAVSEGWYLERSPIFVSGDYYYPAGSSVFFDQNTMVLTGFYGSVPLYADTTLEPHSIVFVPIGRGLMQPYERRRARDVVGTTGSRAPSFPVQRDAEAMLSRDALDVPDAGGFTPTRTIPDPMTAEPAPLPGHGVLTIPRTRGLAQGVWIRFQGSRWFASGPAVVFDPSSFEQIGEYEGFPVFRSRAGLGDRIYIPSRNGIVAPYTKR